MSAFSQCKKIQDNRDIVTKEPEKALSLKSHFDGIILLASFVFHDFFHYFLFLTYRFTLKLI